MKKNKSLTPHPPFTFLLSDSFSSPLLPLLRPRPPSFQLQHEPTQTARRPPHPDGAGSSGRVHGERGALSRSPACKPECAPAFIGLPHLLLPVRLPELRPQLHQPLHLHPAEQTPPQAHDPTPSAQRPRGRQRDSRQSQHTHAVTQNTRLIRTSPTTHIHTHTHNTPTSASL